MNLLSRSAVDKRVNRFQGIRGKFGKSKKQQI